MNCCPEMRRWLAGLATAVIFGGLLAALVLPGGVAPRGEAVADVPKPEAGAWPMFGGTVQRNMVNSVERDVPTEWDVKSGKNVKWVVELGSKAYGGPVIAGGKVFIGTNNDRPRNPRDVDKMTGVPVDKGVMMCFDQGTGKFLWQIIHDKLPAGRVNDWPKEGICSSPFVEGNRLYYVSNRCEVICADTEGLLDGKNDGAQDEKYKEPTDGDVVWSLDMIGALGVFPHNLATCSPIVVGDVVFVITSNGVDERHIDIPKPQAPSFIAVDKKSGQLLWKNNLPTARLLEPGSQLKSLVDRGLVLMHGQWSNPVYTEVAGQPQIIYPGGDGWIYGFEPRTGELIWKFDGNPKDSVYRLGGAGTRNDYVATPVVHDTKLYLGVGQDPEHDAGVGHYWCVDLVKATKNRGDVSPELVAEGGGPQKGKPNPNSAVQWHYGGMIDPPPAEGREYAIGRTMSTASVSGGLAFIGEQEGILHCLDAVTGKEYWQHDMEAATWSSPYTVDGKVFMGNDKRELLIFQHGKEKKLLAKINMGSLVRATPTAVNGTLFVLTENKLYAIGK